GAGSVSDPRSRSQVHRRLRWGIRGRKYPSRPDADSSTGSEWDRRAVRAHRSIGMPGLAPDFRGAASGARAHRVQRSLQRLAASSQPKLGVAEWPDVSGDVAGDATDNVDTSRPSGRTRARVRARGVSEPE